MRHLVKRLGFSINNKSSLQLMMRPYSKRTSFIHTSSAVKSLEAAGFTCQQADGIRVAITDSINHKLNEASQTLVSKSEMQRSMELHQSHMSECKSEIKGLQNKLFLMAEAEMIKLQNELEMKTEAQGVEIKMMLERLRTNQAAAITNISYELEREVCALNALLNSSNVKRKSDLQGMKARVEASYYELKYYCVGAVSIGGLAVGLMVFLL